MRTPTNDFRKSQGGQTTSQGGETMSQSVQTMSQDGQSISQGGPKRGVALMAVLWLIAILSMACMVTLRVISFDMELASSKIHGSRARQVAEMGIAVGCNPAVKKRSDAILHRADEAMGESFEVKIIPEGGRFSINHILRTGDKPFLNSTFVDWGIDLKDAQKITDALLDWYDADDLEQLNGAEKKYYEKEGRINQPFDRPFYDIGEMSLVRGMDLVEAVKPDWRNWFTVWGGKLDLNEADAELIAAALEITVDQADAIPEKVRGTDGVRGTEDDLELELADALVLIGEDPANAEITKRVTAIKDMTGITRIESLGTAEGAKRKITVIVKNRAGKPAILERTEEIIP